MRQSHAVDEVDAVDTHTRSIQDRTRTTNRCQERTLLQGPYALRRERCARGEREEREARQESEKRVEREEGEAREGKCAR